MIAPFGALLRQFQVLAPLAHPVSVLPTRATAIACVTARRPEHAAAASAYHVAHTLGLATRPQLSPVARGGTVIDAPPSGRAAAGVPRSITQAAASPRDEDVLTADE
jgi:hypothetical protein